MPIGYNADPTRKNGFYEGLVGNWVNIEVPGMAGRYFAGRVKEIDEHHDFVLQPFQGNRWNRNGSTSVIVEDRRQLIPFSPSQRLVITESDEENLRKYCEWTNAQNKKKARKKMRK